MNFHTLVSAELVGLEFNREEFVKEYDEYLLPVSSPLASGERTLQRTIETNLQWKMLPTEVYEQANARDEKTGKITEKGFPSWDGTSLIYLDCEDQKLSEKSKNGTVSIRNYVLDSFGEWKFYPQYQNLAIVRYIKNLPIYNIIGARCVSLPPGGIAIIHRDDSSYLPDSGIQLKQKFVDNALWKEGFVQITLNISDGGVPMYYSCTANLSSSYDTINYNLYLFNDYFYHGVPLTTSRRRQIRITARPLPALVQYINQTTVKNLIHNF